MENSEKKTVSRTVIDREVIMEISCSYQNFRNLKDVKVTLSPLTILTGENGSGKSTLFKALLFLKHNHDHEAAKKLKYVIDDDINLGGWEHIANDPKKPISIKITEETWGYDHEVEEIYDIDNCPFELNPTEEYAKQWAQFLNKYGISSSLEPFLPKSQRLNTTSGRRIHISSREFVYSEDKLESILLKTGISDIKFKIKYFSKPYSEDIRSLDEMFYPLGKNQFYLMFEKIDTASRIPSDLLPGITKLFFELYSDSTWVSEYNEEKALYEEILNNLRMTILGGEQLTKYSAFRKFIPLTLRSIIESLSYAQYMNILGILYELLDELNDILYKGFINAFSLGTTRKLPESRYLVEN
ncbi:MAG: AAA family ATPase [Ignavibacteriales bacterium]|nr:AAA family ATPase [Ignavibacteriales bacterium]